MTTYTIQAFKDAFNGRMTKQAVTIIKGDNYTIRVDWNSEYEEWRVMVLGLLETAYFTDCPQDAFDTAVAIAH